MRNVPAYNSLHHIGSVETVHTVGSKVATLSLGNCSIFEKIKLTSVVVTVLKLTHKVAIAVDFALHDVHEF